MRAWFFSENAYHLLPDPKEYDSIRVKLPNRYYDPKIGADLYHRFIDEWQIAEDLGLEIMVNEHHQTATNLNPSAAVVMGCAPVGILNANACWSVPSGRYRASVRSAATAMKESSASRPGMARLPSGVRGCGFPPSTSSEKVRGGRSAGNLF